MEAGGGVHVMVDYINFGDDNVCSAFLLGYSVEHVVKRVVDVGEIWRMVIVASNFLVEEPNLS